MQKQNTPVSAAIDIGSNTIRVVVARCRPDVLEIVASDEALVRIGESVNNTGNISEQKRDEAMSVLRRYIALAKKHEADPILAVATEAVRKAGNKEEFLAAIERETGLVVRIIEGDVEAPLTFYGATYELNREANPPTQVAVIDLGGGSTELVLAKYMRITWHTSLPVGSGWLHDRYLHSDPLSVDDVVAARSFLQTYLQGQRIKRFPPVLVATGGSANTLLLLAQRAFGLSEGQKTLSRDDLVRCEGLLRALPAEDIARRYGIEAKRARILGAGVMILRAVLDRFQLPELRVSTEGIREGVLLAYTRFGEQWLQQVQQQGEEATQGNGGLASDDAAPPDKESETFAQAGNRLLRERVKKMVEWHDEVLKHEDVEAVHKMRVASRRLRAVLDAYQPICEPRGFKKVYRRVKELADILGQARDTDVMIENLHARLEQVSHEEQIGIHWLIDHLSDYREEHQKKLETFLGKFDDDTFEQQVASCLPAEGARNGKS